MNITHLRGICASLVCASLTALSAPAAHADLYRDVVFGSSQFDSSSQLSVDSLTSSMSALGSSDVTMPAPIVERSPDYPKPVDESITQVEIVGKELEAHDRWERWTVASPAMKRNISVQIYRAADPIAPAPMVYLLDGIDATYEHGWYVQRDTTEKVFGGENATLVLPTEARGSMYSNWQHPDPALGVNMWETFLVDELAPLLEAESELNFNGKRAVGGLSMGATGEIHLANTNPDLFDAVFGISGCYSPTTPISSQMVGLIVTSRGASTENLWGPFGSEGWFNHDTVLNPEGLRNQAVYLSAANGALSEEERAYYNEKDSPFSMSNGVLLETGAKSCTEQLDQALQADGATNLHVDYADHGGHNWFTFLAQLQPAWNHIKPALY